MNLLESAIYSIIDFYTCFSAHEYSTAPEIHESSATCISESMQISSKDLLTLSLIKADNISEIYAGRWKGKEVVINKYIVDFKPSYLKFLNSFCTSNHPNLLKTVGFCLEEEMFCRVTEKADTSFKNLVHKGEDISWRDKIHHALKISLGLRDLHIRNIAHDNFCSDNISFKDKEPKLDNYDLSELHHAVENLYREPSGQMVPYISRDALDPNNGGLDFRKSEDVYAYSMVLWEMVKRQKPFMQFSSYQIYDHLLKGGHETIPKDCPRLFKDIIQKCWNSSYRERPSIELISQALFKHFKTISYLAALQNSGESVLAAGAMKDIWSKHIAPAIANSPWF